MAKSQNKIKKTKVGSNTGSGVRATAPDDESLKFSFRFFDPSDKEVCPETFKEGYTQTLMQRLRDLSRFTVKEFRTTNHKSVRGHKIDWGKTARPDGFTNLNEQFQMCEPWQFQLTANEHGRVHGVFVGGCFYVIWLDHHHAVYPKRK
tara:strand:+ start:10875 stop:11318 length:444 start_codon:yes stop_codon:yes gene_type:complete